jgi:hypothetical protein
VAGAILKLKKTIWNKLSLWSKKFSSMEREANRQKMKVGFTLDLSKEAYKCRGKGIQAEVKCKFK